MKATVGRNGARCEGLLEERDELGLVEGPDGLTRFLKVDLISKGMVEAEEVDGLVARALTRDGVPIRMALALSEADADPADGVLKDDVAVPSDGCRVEMGLARRLEREKLISNSEEAPTRQDEEAGEVPATMIQGVVDEALDI